MMRGHLRLFLSSAVVLLPLSGCGTSPTPPPPAKATVPAGAAAATLPAKAATPTSPQPPVVATAAASSTALKYEAKGRRDPFSAVSTLEGSKTATIAAAKLRGVVHGHSGILALVDTAEGVGYIVKPGDTLADGRVVEIGRDSVVFAVAPRPGASTNRVILRLPTD
jgi:Tfp pilus assembly protein PilP